jgi:hypothetical protein
MDAQMMGCSGARLEHYCCEPVAEAVLALLASEVGARTDPHLHIASHHERHFSDAYSGAVGADTRDLVWVPDNRCAIGGCHHTRHK